MARSLKSIKFLLGFMVIISIITSKYFNSLLIFLPILFLSSIFYHIETNKRRNKVVNYEDILINISEFIIYTGILGYVLVRIIGYFIEGFN